MYERTSWDVPFSFMPEIKIDYVGFNKISSRSDDVGGSIAVGKERKVRKEKRKETEIATGATMARRRTLEGGRTESAKTQSGQFWTITIVFIAPETVSTFFWKTPKRETYPRSLDRFISLRWAPPAPSICSVVFFGHSPLLASCRNSDRLAYIPLRFHSVFRASPRKDFTRCGQKKEHF